jgi:hypothetical protein
MIFYNLDKKTYSHMVDALENTKIENK